jgi:hypothetical protein
MTEGNFVDYVKIFVSSGKEEKDLRIYIENLLKRWTGWMVVMEVVVDMFFL